MIDHLELEYKLKSEVSCFTPKISLLIGKEPENRLLFHRPGNNYHATDYRFEVGESNWLGLVADADRAVLEKVGSNTYYFRSNSHDSVYLLRLLDYLIFMSYDHGFLWVTTEKEIEEINIPDFLFKWRNIDNPNSSYYRERHPLVMECLLYLGLVNHEKEN